MAHQPSNTEITGIYNQNELLKKRVERLRLTVKRLTALKKPHTKSHTKKRPNKLTKQNQQNDKKSQVVREWGGQGPIE